MISQKTKDLASFLALYNNYAPPFYGLLLRLAPTPAMAGCCLEKGLEKIWKELDGYDALKGSVFAFMLRIILKECEKDFKLQEHLLNNLASRKN